MTSIYLNTQLVVNEMKIYKNFNTMKKHIGICWCLFLHGCAIDVLILGAVKHKRLCFHMKSTNVGMTLINVWSILFIEKLSGISYYMFHVSSATIA